MSSLIAAMDVAPKPRLITPRLIAIISGAGGAGKTWLSQTLAEALGQRRVRVLVLDAGHGNANAPSSNPAGHDPGQSLVDALLAEPNSTTGYDIIILDLPSRLDDRTRRLAALANTVLLVATPDPASVTEAYAALKLLKQDRGKPGLKVDARIIVSQAPNADAGKRAYAALSRAARRFLRLDPSLAGIIAHDERVTEAIGPQKPPLGQFSYSTAELEVQAIARRLLLKP